MGEKNDYFLIKPEIMKIYERFCQSCGMPMHKDPFRGGTNTDGTRTHKFCSHCYENGKFRDHFSSSEEMIARIQERLREMGYSPLKQWFFTSHISRLERWNP
jgi:hypothetical protein